MERERVFSLNGRPSGRGPVLYWMSRDQRAEDNHALIFSLELAAGSGAPCHAAFCLAPGYPGAALRHYSFMIEGLCETERELHEHGIPFHLLEGDPAETVPRFAVELGAGAVVTDFDPLRIKRSWQRVVAQALPVAFYDVDTHNVVPCRHVSDRQEWSAFTLRKKIHRLLDSFLFEPPPLTVFKAVGNDLPSSDWEGALGRAAPDPAVPAVNQIRPGASAAAGVLESFIRDRLPRYHLERNDPNAGAQSGLSPYLHFGQISPLRVSLAVGGADAPPAAREAFLEELVVRRELSDNFCLHNPDYDRYEGLPAWGRRTLEAHADDPREYLYNRSELERAVTHDRLWNAAQTELALFGRMPGYLRMYWAKKILEWSEDPGTALDTANYLNDHFALDGRDPNGYVGAAWSIGGLHDRPWAERPVFGTVRYMNLSGCRRKFDVERYVERILDCSN